MKLLALSFVPCLAFAAPPLTDDNLPLGSAEQPLVLRTYVPDPGLDRAVFPLHGTGLPASNYNPDLGRDTPGEVQPVKGIPAAIAVNFGPALSYVFDTTECRLLYAWQGGFLDMSPYWGEPGRGTRRSFDYVPRLVGTLFLQTEGAHPIEIGGTPLSRIAPLEFIGYRLEKEVPRFEIQAGEHKLTLSLTPSETPLSLEVDLTCEPAAALVWRGVEGARGKGRLHFTLTGTALSHHQGYPRDHRVIQASVAAGKALFSLYGCMGCHSVDGSKSHGPTLAGVAGSMIELEGNLPAVPADRDYLRESIRNPNAKVVKGYPPNYMPPFVLPEAEVESLALYIESLATPE